MSTTYSACRRASYLVLGMHVVVASHQPLPAKGYGGPQRVVVALVRGLAALGHRVTLLAPPSTRVPEATVVAVPPRKLADPATLAPYVPRDAAIVHAHFPLRSAPGSFPFVQTVHRNLKPHAPAYPNSIFLSRDHARRHHSDVFVYNGLDPADYVFRRFPRRGSQYDLFLGNLHSAKGYHWAVEAAKRTGHRLIVAGGWRPSFRIDQVRRRSGRRNQSGAARACPVPVEPGRVGRAVRPGEDRGVSVGHARARDPSGRTPRADHA